MTLTNQIEVRNLQTTSPTQDGPDVLEMAESFEFVLDESRFPPQVIRGRGDTGTWFYVLHKFDITYLLVKTG